MELIQGFVASIVPLKWWYELKSLNGMMWTTKWRLTMLFRRKKKWWRSVMWWPLNPKATVSWRSWEFHNPRQKISWPRLKKNEVSVGMKRTRYSVVCMNFDPRSARRSCESIDVLILNSPSLFLPLILNHHFHIIMLSFGIIRISSGLVKKAYLVLRLVTFNRASLLLLRRETRSQSLLMLRV